MLQAPNVAHVEAVSGPFIVPAYSSYDRQMLRDYRGDYDDATCMDCAMQPQHNTGAKGHDA